MNFWATAGLIAALLLVNFLLREKAGPDIVGRVSAGDGDSFRIGEERIRLEGIDAPELAQTCFRDGKEWPCGRESKAHLARIIAGREITCTGTSRDRFDRVLARCRVGETDINAAQVRAGWAIAYGDYAAEEAEAEAERLGLWQGTFERPRDWRTMHGDMMPEF
ncbi:MAG: thermonuclease family protein [Hyphomicrobiales bacterium]